MKNWPLSVQISVMFTSLLLLMGLTIMSIIPNTLSHFFTNEIFTVIENSQGVVSLNDEKTADDMIKEQQTVQNARSVSHIFIDKSGHILNEAVYLPRKTLSTMYELALKQQSNLARYETTVQKEQIYFVIRKRQVGFEQIFQISYMWDSYREELVRTLFKKLFIVMFYVLIGGIGLSLLFAKWFSNPIVKMKKHVTKIAERKWDEPLVVDRNDEIGILAKSIDKMRIQLMEQDKAQQTMLQHISHDLKTPVMVIHSYAKAIQDGIYPNGTLEGSAETIKKEAIRLEAKIKDLLYLTKLNYLAQKNRDFTSFNIKQLIDEIIPTIQNRRKDINFALCLMDQEIIADREQWKVVIENLLDNALRYAKTTIEIKMENTAHFFSLTIANDGPPIDPIEKQSLFKPYVKGKQGNFGLGLTIVKRILDLHHAKITVENTDNGVAFIIQFHHNQ